jgi:hypothetical protein
MVEGQLYRHKQKGFYVLLKHKAWFLGEVLWIVKTNSPKLKASDGQISSLSIKRSYELIANNYQPK